jgi:LuxR family maltose regulon positive regulatory protein
MDEIRRQAAVTSSDVPAVAPFVEPPTNREMDVLLLLDKRYTNKEIAEALSISQETVRTHVRHLGDKLGVRGRRTIIEAARQQRLV